MSGWSTPADVRAENGLLRDTHGFDDIAVQRQIDMITRTMKMLLRPRWSTYLTASYWLADEPSSVPPTLRDICTRWTVGKCLLAAYGNRPDIREEAYILMAEERRLITGVNVGRAGEIPGLNQLLKIEDIDGTLRTGTSDLIEASEYEEDSADDEYHDLSELTMDTSGDYGNVAGEDDFET